MATNRSPGNTARPAAGELRSILVVDDDRDFAHGMADLLEVEGFSVHVALNAEEARAAIARQSPGIALVDVRLGVTNGVSLIATLRELSPRTVYVVMTAYADVESAIQALREGAYLYLRKPLPGRELLATVDRCWEHLRLQHAKETAEAALRQHNRELQERNRRLHMMVESVRAFAACTTPSELGSLILKEFSRNMGAGSSSFYLSQIDCLTLLDWLGEQPIPRQLPVFGDESTVLGRVLRDHSACLIERIEPESALDRPIADAYKQGSLLVIPLATLQGEVHGVVFLHRAGTPPFTQEDRDLAQILASVGCEAFRAARAAVQLLSQSQETISHQQALLELGMLNFDAYDEALRRILEVSTGTLNAVRSALWLLSENGHALRCTLIYDAGAGAFAQGITLQRKDVSTFVEAVEQHALIAVSDVRKHPFTRELAARMLEPRETCALLAAPVWAGSRFTGIVIYQHAEAGRQWRTQEQSFADSITRLVALAMEARDRRHAEEALRLSRFALDSAAETMLTLLPDGRICDVNQTACSRLGLAAEELTARYWWDVNLELTADAWPPLWDSLRRDRLRVLTMWHRTGAGEKFPAEVAITYFSYAGREYGCAFIRDITERLRAEEERLKLESQMLHAQKLESLGVLAGGIAHDFNNLLMGILGNASLVLMDLPENSELRQPLVDIEHAAQRATDLCNQMLAYSGKGSFVIEQVNLSAIVEEMTHLLKVSVSKRAALECHFVPDLPPIDGDPTQLRQIVMNLIINASDALGENEGVISITTNSVECSREMLAATYLDDNLPPGRYVLLEVADTGCGMDSETQSRIFDPFFTTKFAGRGLGMAAVLGIVRGHRGAIRVESAPAGGARFQVFFPVSTAATGHVPRIVHGTETWRTEATVLVIEDEEAVRSLAQRMLERLGCTVRTAVDGLEGVEVFRRYADTIDVVLLDMTMPRMSGEEAYYEMRRIHPGVRIVLTSGYSEKEIAPRFMGQGLAGFLQKPFRPQDLRDALQAALAGGIRERAE